MAGGDAGIVEAPHLLRDFRQIDRHLVVLDDDLDLDRHALADIDAVIVHVGLGLVGPVGDGARAGARRDLAMIHDRGDGGEHLVPAIAVEQLQEAPLAGLDRRHLCAQIAHRAAWDAHVDADDVDHVLVDLAGLVELEIGQLQALGINVGGHAAQGAADVDPVRHAAGKSRERALVEDRQRERDVIEVAAGRVGVVGDEDVAGMDVGAEMLQLRLDRLGHAADEHRQADADRDRLARSGIEAGGEIQGLVDDHVVGGAHEVRLHFLGHGDDAVAHDLGDDGIGLADLGRGRFERRHHFLPATVMTRLPHSSTTSLSPGLTTVVEACSSTSAGPLMRLPARSPARA